MQVPKTLSSGATRLTPDPGNTISMAVARSDMTEWCWAAVAVGIAAYYNDYDELRQCDVANRIFNNTVQCCFTNAVCNCQKLLSKALDEHFDDFEFDGCKRTLEFVKNEIDNNRRPVPVHLVKGNDGHLIVIAKYWIDQQGVEFFGIWDPDFIQAYPEPCSVAKLLTNYRGGWTWNYSYLTK